MKCAFWPFVTSESWVFSLSRRFLTLSPHSQVSGIGKFKTVGYFAADFRASLGLMHPKLPA